MNRAYQLVWSRTQQAWVVTGELARGRKKSSGKGLKATFVLLAGLSAAGVHAAPAIGALPAGESVVSGSATFDRSVADQLTVNQNSSKLITNWNSFDIGSSATVNFVQPDTSSIALNRVSSGSATEIFGKLNANGQLFIVNPNGITFGAGSQVSAATLIASSLEMTDGDFNTDNYLFTRGAIAGKVENHGSISAQKLVLLSPEINNTGSLTAIDGNIALINADQASANSYSTTQVSTVAGVIKNTGTIQATRVGISNGFIRLEGDQSQASSVVELAGSISADGLLSVAGKNIATTNALSLTADTVLSASDNIYIKAPTSLGSDKSLNLEYGSDAGEGYFISPSASLNLSGAGSEFVVNGWNYSIIYDVNQLQNISSNLSGRYVLGSNIDATATTGWNGGAGFNPVGSSVLAFTGTLDGLGHTVNGLYINRGSTDNVGLLGYAQNASLRNIGLTNASITGQGSVGGLLGYLNTTTGGSSSIENSYVSGAVTAVNTAGGLLGSSNNVGGMLQLNLNYSRGSVSGGSNLGGLLGYVYSDNGAITTVSNSYSESSVTATGNNVGGLMGWNYVSNPGDVATSSVVSNSYATGAVSAPGARVGGLVGVNLASNTNFSTAIVSDSYASGAVSGGSDVGGLIGSNTDFASAINNYWDSATSGQATAIGSGTGAMTNVLAVVGSTAGASAYTQAGYANFDFNNEWFIAQVFGRPMLRAFLNSANQDGNVAVGSLYQLQGMSGNLAGNYYLTQDIDASRTASSVTAGEAANYADVWGGRGFAPVGHSNIRFTGDFNGNGHVINGLNIKRVSNDNVGLFGFADGSTLRDVGLTNLNISGKDYTAGLVGYFRSTAALGNALIDGVYVSGQVSGEDNVGGVGGIVVTLNSGTQEVKVANSYSNVNVTATTRAGSLLGFFGSNFTNASAILENSYATGSVTGSDYIGGLVGRVYNQISTGNSTIVRQTYASGAVTGSTNTGGLVGNAFNPTVSLLNNYWNTDTSGQVNGVGSIQNTAAVSNVVGLTTAQSTQLASYANWGNAIDAQGGTGAAWRIYDGQTTPLLRNFLTGVDVNIGNATKTYDANAYHVTGGSYTLSDPAANLLGSISYGPGTAEGARNAGTYSLTGTGLYSTQHGYDIRFVDGTLTVNKAELNITSTDVTKTYDGTRNAIASAVITGGTQLFGSDSISGGTFEFDVKNAGVPNAIWTSGVTVNDGHGGNNYNVTYINNSNAVINKRVLTLTATPFSKEYDGNVRIDLKPLISGRQRGDSISGLTQSFADKNAGTGKTVLVNTGFVINDENGGNNYDVVIVNSNAGVITPKALTISTVANTKVYDGGVTSANKPLVSGLVMGDRVTGLFQQYETKTVGTGKKLLIKNGYVLQDSNGGNNYTITEQASNDGVITAH